MANPELLMVTIRCLAYNHEPYIRQCLDGFVMQKTNFRFEAVVHDDASTDGTADIIREYSAKYPEIIKPIFEIENQYSKRDGSLRRIMNAHMKGKYIAICEGDDYWTDPLKLQKQVDFLETHPDYSMCSHNFIRLFQSTQLLDCVNPNEQDFTIEDLIAGNLPIQTATILFRNLSSIMEQYGKLQFAMDASLFYFGLKAGKCHILKDVLSVYRIHSSGTWSGSTNNSHIQRRLVVVKSIYDCERSDLAARYLLNQYSKGVSRKWILSNFPINTKIFIIGVQHLGFIKMCSFVFKKMVLGKNVIL